MSTFKPMLACEADLAKVQFPVYASPKLDGIRCAVVSGRALTRSLKEIPNRYVFDTLSKKSLEGLDGELIVGDPTSKTVYRDTVSGVMGHEGQPLVAFYVFDMHDIPQATYRHRLDCLMDEVPSMNTLSIPILIHKAALVQCLDDLLEYEEEVVGQGYEGLILRNPESPYKFGRSTMREQYLLKVKRFVDGEAEIIGFEEEMFNGNVAETNELGRTKRSTEKAGLVPKGTLGALQVRDAVSGVQFSIGTGFVAAERQHIWNRQRDYLGKLVKYKSFLVGVKDKPRHPVYLGMRDARDL